MMFRNQWFHQTCLSVLILLAIVPGCKNDVDSTEVEQIKAEPVVNEYLIIGSDDQSRSLLTGDTQIRLMPFKNKGIRSGRYCSVYEVYGYTRSVLELDQDGSFEYWFGGDVQETDDPEYPISGSYKISDDVLNLNSSVRLTSKWYFVEVNGITVLMRDDAYKYWQEEQVLHAWGILIGMADPDEDFSTLLLPAMTDIPGYKIPTKRKD